MAVKEWRWSQANPVRDITKRKEARGRVRFLSDTEAPALLAPAPSLIAALHTLVLLANIDRRTPRRTHQSE